jgi:hypothetical protein
MESGKTEGVEVVVAQGLLDRRMSGHLCSQRRRFAIAQAGEKRDSGLETAGKSGDCQINARGKKPRI